LRFVADADVAPTEHATATTSARMRVVMISLLGHADALMAGPPTSGYGTNATTRHARSAREGPTIR
jgi:hypothetical protein